MGADATVLGVGSFKVFRDLGLLDYLESLYTYMEGDVEKLARDDQTVVCTVAFADTTEQSHFLAEICNVGWPGLVDCQVVNPISPSSLCSHDSIGEDDGEKVYSRLKTLISLGVKLYFLPNY
jgi:hypothetical protein